MSKISVTIITFNEEKNIERCIRSVLEVADEIIVVDSGSTDKTVEIASSLGAKIIEHEFVGHIEQKNFAIDQTRYDWVLSLDADEALSDVLKTNLLKEKSYLSGSGYSFNRLTNYCGKWIRHCGWYPDRKLRLFRKGHGAWGGNNPHDKYEINNGGRANFLKGDILHYTFYNVEEHRAQIERFSTIAAQSMYEQGKSSSVLKAFFKGVFKFVRNYIIKLGFLDGKYGWQICLLSAKATYKRYLKLNKLGRSNG